MNKDTYINLQLSNIDHAINLGEKAIKTALTLQNLTKKKDDNENAFLQDTMKYYNFSDAVTSIEFLPLQIKDFKNQLIEIKMENDKMLLEGGFIGAIDKEIAEIFSGAFGQTHINLPTSISGTQEAIEILKRLKTELQ